MSIILDDTSAKTLEALESAQECIFLTGHAGTGKSTLLDIFRNQTKKNIAVVAPTGVAAVNVSGETIHSFFGLPPGVTPEKAQEEGRATKKSKLFKTLEILVIDEISMVRADLLDSIDSFLRSSRKSTHPFGGVKVIMVGDLHQLPPVVTNEERDALSEMYVTPYFFSSNVFGRLLGGLYTQLKFIELNNIYRQTEGHFISLLNKIRDGDISDTDLEKLNIRVVGEGDVLEDHIVLTAINEQADQINSIRLSQIDGPTYNFQASRVGEFIPHHSPAAETVSLKTGSRVMLLNNDPAGRWINGTIGTLFRAQSDHVYVKLDNGELEKVEPFVWKSFKTVYNPDKNSLETEERGSFKQLPVRLAWAITIHKSQGKTFEKVAVDLGRGAFAHGQTYVALSRCTSLNGLKLLRPITRDSIIMDSRVKDFLKSLKQQVGLS